MAPAHSNLQSAADLPCIGCVWLLIDVVACLQVFAQKLLPSMLSMLSCHVVITIEMAAHFWTNSGMAFSLFINTGHYNSPATGFQISYAS